MSDRIRQLQCEALEEVRELQRVKALKEKSELRLSQIIAVIKYLEAGA